MEFMRFEKAVETYRNPANLLRDDPVLLGEMAGIRPDSPLKFVFSFHHSNV